MNRYVKLILVLWVALPALINCSRQVDEPSNSIDGEEVTWELRNYNGSTVVGSGDPPKLWVRTFPPVKQKKVNEKARKSQLQVFGLPVLVPPLRFIYQPRHNP